MSDEQLIVTIGAKDSASTIIKKVNQELKYLDKEYKLAEQGSKDFDKSMDGLQTKLSSLEKKYEANNIKLQAYRKQLETAREGVSRKEEELKKLSNAEGDNTLAIEKAEKQLSKYKEQMANATRNINLTELEMRNLNQEINDTNSSLNNFKVDQYNKKLKDMQKSTEEVANKFKSVGDGFEKVGGGITKISLAGVAAGTALGAMAKSTEDDLVGLEGKLGLTKEEADKLREVAKSVYNDGFSESIGESINGLVSLQQNLKSTKKWTDDTKKSILEQMSTITDLFGAETGELTKTLAVMQNSGLTDDIEQALDIITRGFQEGGDYSGELLDTLREYSPQFVKLGLSADEALNYLITGAENGAFNLDKVGDAMKEFSIRAIDGSKTTIEGFQAINMNADEMAIKFAEGGDSAKGAFKEVVQAIAKIDDPVKQSIVGINLFGTMWEDLGPQVITSLGTVEGGLANVEGATERAGEALQGTFDFKFKKSLREVREDLLPLGVEVLDLAKESLPTLTDAIRGITKFLSEMDDGTKRNIIRTTLLGTAVGTTTIGIGKFTKGIGNVTEFAGKYIPKIGEMTEKFGGFTKKTDSTTKGIGELAKGMNILNPVTLTVGATMAAVAGTMIVAKTNSELMQKGISYTTDEMNGLEKAVALFNGTNFKSRKELEASGVLYKEFSNDISIEFQEKVKANTKSINDFAMKLHEINFDGVISEEESAAFINDVDKTASEAINAIKARQEESNKAMQDMFISDGVIDESEKRVIELMNRSGETQINEVNQLKTDILAIEQKALEEKRILTEGEIKIIQDKNARIRQIELENLGKSKEEIIYATNEFQERIKNIDIEGAKEIVAEKAKIRDDEAAKISAGYDTHIQLMKDKLSEVTGEDRKALEEQIEIAETKKSELLSKNNELYDGYLAILNEKNPIVMENINRFNGQELSEADFKKQEMLKKLQEQYDGLNSITETGNYMMLDKTGSSLVKLSVVVDEKTGEITGIYDTFSGNVGAYSEDIANSVIDVSKEYEAGTFTIKEALENMASSTVNTKGQIVNANGEVVLSLQEVKVNADGTREGVLNLNGTPINVKADTNGAISNLEDVNYAIDNIPGTKRVTISAFFEAIGNGIKGIFGFAEGTNYAPPGPALVAEEGQELIVSRSGRALLTGNSGAQLFNFNGGEKVYTNAETEKILAGLDTGYFNSDSYKSQSLIRNNNTINNYNSSISNSSSIDLTSTIKSLAAEISSSLIEGLKQVTLQSAGIYLDKNTLVGTVSTEFATQKRKVR